MGKLTDEEKIQIVELYSNGESSISLGKKFGIDATNILALLRRRGVPINSKGAYKKYHINEDVFLEINTEEKAHWLGFICADGHVNDNSVRCEISNKDFEHLNKMRIFFESDHLVRLTRKNCVVIDFNSRKLVQSLRLLGLEKNKTKNIKTPKIDANLLKHFYRGTFDGDGWITSRQAKNTKLEYCSSGLTSWEIGMSSGSSDFIHEFHDWVCLAIGGKCGCLIDRKRNENQQVWQLTFGGNNNFVKICNLFYNDATIFLDRKYVKWQHAKQNISTIIDGHRRFTRPMDETSAIDSKL